MTTYNTGNPVPSTALPDLYDNAENLDSAMNGTDKTWTDRIGVVRKSWAGIEKDVSDATASATGINATGWETGLNPLSAITPTAASQRATVPESDNGTHTDPATGATVQNSGTYASVLYNGNLVWQWQSADALSLKADQVDLDSTNARIEPFERIGSPPAEFSVLDENGRVLAQLPKDVAAAVVVERICSAGAPTPAVIDINNRVLAWNGCDRDDSSDVKETPAGFYAPERMRKINLFRAGRGADKAVRLSLAVIGDSWVDGAEYWMRTLCKMLRNKFGDGGIGYADIGSYSVLRDDVMTRTIGSDWVMQDETVPGPAIYSRTCSVAGGAINYVVSNAPALTGARLYWIGSTDGVIRYRWDSGNWVTLNVKGSGAQTADLTGYAAAGSYTLDIELVSGTAQLCGIDFQSEDAGIVVHKLGNAGSRADDWLSVDATIWEGFITQLDFDSAAICLGTNDRFAGVSADLYASRISEMISRIRTALPDSASLPGPDIMSIIPSRVWRDTPLSMDEYKSAILGIADDLDIAVTELISAIGDPYTRRDWFDSNGVHPLPESGGLVVASRLFAALNS